MALNPYMNPEDLQEWQASQKINPQNPEVQPGNPQKSRSQQILESIYANAAPPPPVYNEQLQKRREKVARLNAAGRGFNVLGDVLSLATGANVQKRQPDQITPAMLNSYQNYIQDYDNRTDRFNYQNYRDNLMNKRLLYQDAVRQEDLLREEKRYQDAQEWKKLGFKTEQEWREFQKERAAKDDELQKERLEWQKQAPYVQHKLMTEREQQEAQNRLQYMMSKAAFDQAKDGFVLYDDAGNPVKSIDKGMMNRLVKTILQDPETAKFAENDLQLMKGSFEGLSTNAMNSIIGFYWDKSPMARELLRVNEPKQSSIPSNWQAPRPAYQGPVREGTQQPTQPQPIQQAPVQQPQQPIVPNVPSTKSTPGQGVIDTTAINNKYQGIDITSGTPYETALKVAVQQGIINPNVQPTSEQFAAIKQIEEQVKRDAEALRAARVAEGVGIVGNKPQQQQSTGFDYGSLNFNLQ